ncbi:MerC domain-containing protein [Bacillus sp. FJAT-44742]|uniref:MerC domain-containing protein n=1 Tax=Bacillus sp. FJAT-44742 TaxID=2014005 RepID=UPI000C24B63F|nr:MerC domain-containing protein [Bacillus sp. FJAT-44742]
MTESNSVENKTKFYEKSWFAWVALIIFAPLGIFLMFKYGHHNKGLRIAVSVIFGLFFAIRVFGDSDESVPATAEVNNDKEVVEESIDNNEEEENNTSNNEENNEANEPEEVVEEEEPVVVEEIAFSFEKAEYNSETETFDIEVSTDLPDGTKVTLALKHPDEDYTYNGSIETVEVADGSASAKLTTVDDEWDGPYPIKNGEWELAASLSVRDGDSKTNTHLLDVYGSYDEFVEGYKIDGSVKETDVGYIIEGIAKQNVEISGAYTEEDAKALRAEFKKQTADTIDFAHLEKNPDRYIGEYVTYSGEIAEIQESNGYTVVRLALDDFYSDIIWVEYDGYTDFVTEDKVTIYGEVWGSHSYTSQAGWEITVPAIMADVIE